MGFSELSLEQNLVITQPSDVTFSNGQLSTNEEVTIAVPLPPTTEKKEVTPDTEKLEAGLTGEGKEDINMIEDGISYTLGNVNSPDSGDGIITDDNNEKCIVLNNPSSDDDVRDAVNHLTPGTTEFFDKVKGMTMMLSAGKGYVDVEYMSDDEETNRLKAFIGSDDEHSNPFELKRIEKKADGKIKARLAYDIEKPRLAALYYSNLAHFSRGVHKGGKKSVTHIRVYSVTITPSTVKQSNSVKDAAGEGNYGAKDPNEDNVVDIMPVEGDVNGDFVVDGDDVRDVVNYIMGIKGKNFDEEAADVNNDNVVNIADIIKIINLMKM